MMKAELREQIGKLFITGELKSLCFDLEIKYDNLPGETLDDKVRELIDYCDRYGMLPKLLRRCFELRPNKFHWPVEEDPIYDAKQKSPEDKGIGLELGITPVEPLSYIRKRTKLPDLAEVSQGYPHFQLVLRNTGNVVARHVRLHLEFESFQDYSYRDVARSDIELLSAPVVKMSEGNPFTWQNNRDFIFNGGVDWLLYPNEDEIFSFSLKTVVEGQPPVPYDYYFRCTARAEGIIEPVQRNLSVRVVKQKFKL